MPINPETGRPRQEYRSTVEASADIVDAVPLVIVVENLRPYSAVSFEDASGDAARSIDDYLGLVLESFAIGAAVENMWLAATSLGLAGTFMVDIAVAAEVVATRLGVEGQLLGALALGYTQEPPSPPMDKRTFPGIERTIWHE